MKRKTRKSENLCDTKNHKEIVPYLNISDNCKVIKLQDIHEPVRETKPHVFDISNEIIERFNISFNDNETIRLETSYYNFFELIYWVVDSVIGKNVSNSVLTSLQNFNNLSQATDITEEEEIWVNGVLSRNPDEFTLVKIQLTEEDQKNYLINVHRIFKNNINNPNFNQDLLGLIPTNR